MNKSGGIHGTQESRNKDLRGFVLGVLRTGTIVGQSLPETGPDQAVEVYILDVSAPPGRQLMFPKYAKIDSKDDLALSTSLSKIIPVADRKWEIVIIPGAGSFDDAPGRLPWVVLLGGLLYTAGLSQRGVVLQGAYQRSERWDVELTHGDVSAPDHPPSISRTA